MKLAKITVRDDNTCTVQLKENVDGKYNDGIEFKTSKDVKDYTKSVGCTFTKKRLRKLASL